MQSLHCVQWTPVSQLRLPAEMDLWWLGKDTRNSQSALHRVKRQRQLLQTMLLSCVLQLLYCRAFFFLLVFISRQNSTAETDAVRACFTDGNWTAVNKDDALFHNWTEKSRKTTKETDREYKAKHRYEKHTIWWSDDHSAWQNQM